MKADQSNAVILRELGTRLKQQRASLNMDQKTRAYESGVPLRTLSRLENGRHHFMTKRFDRTASGEKLHMQALGALAHYDFNMAAPTVMNSPCKWWSAWN